MPDGGVLKGGSLNRSTSGDISYAPPVSTARDYSGGQSYIQPPGSVGKGSSWMSGLGMAAGLGAALLGSFFGRSRDSRINQNAQTAIAETPDTYVPDSYSAYADFGGAQDVMLPQLTSVANQAALYNRILLNLGFNKVFPVLSTEVFSVISGNDQIASVAYDFGYGPQNLSDFRINDQPIEQFTTVKQEIQEGKDSDVAFTLVKTVGGQNSFSIPLKFNVAQSQTLNKVGKYLTVDIYFPQGCRKINTVTLTNGYVFKEEVATPVGFFVACRKIGDAAWTDLDSIYLNENTRTAFRRTYSFTVPEGAYEVRLTRAHADAPDDGSRFDASSWERIGIASDAAPWGVVKDSSGNPIKMARTAVEAKATDELQGAIGQYSAIAKSEVPSWHTDTSWSAPAISNNPAWLALWVLKGPMNYKPLADSDIDLPSFKAWADACTAAGITYNRMQDSETTPQKVLREIMVIGRAKMIQPTGTKLAVMVDGVKSTIVQHFTTRNSWGFSWKASRSKTPDLLKVQWLNPAIGYQQDERLVYNDGKSAENMQTFQTVQLPGCTDAAIAYKYGRFFLAQDRARRRVYQFYTHHEGLLCTQGDLIQITNPMIGAGLGQGRIKSFTINGSDDITGITLDSRMQMEAGTSYLVRIRLKDGSYINEDIVTVAGKQKTLTFSTPIPHGLTVLPAKDDLVMFGSVVTGREVIVTNIEWTKDLTCMITAVDYAPGIYSADTGPVPAFESLVQKRHPVQITVATPIILNVASDESVLSRDYDGGLRTQIVMQMQPVEETVQYFQVQYKRPDSTIWTDTEPTSASGGRIAISGVQDGVTYDIRVRAVRFDSYKSDWNSTLVNYLCIGKTTPPPTVPPPELDPITGNPRWYYDVQHGVNVPLDFAGFRVKMHWGYNTDWSTGTIISQLQTGTVVDISKFAGGLKSILIKAVDVAGFESTEAAVIIRDFGRVIPANIVAQFDYAPAWPGTKTNCTIIANKLSASDANLFWQNDSNTFWSGIDTTEFWAGQYAEMSYEFTYTPDRSQIAKPFTVALDIDILSAGYKVEYQADGGNLFWNGAPNGGDTNFWDNRVDSSFWTQDTQWHPMPEKGLEGFYGQYRFKITCFAGRFRSVINTLSVIVDVPDVIRRYAFEITDAAGARCPVVSGDFVYIKYVNPALALDAAHPAAYAPEVTDTLLSGPLIRMRDTAGGYTTGKVFVEVAGY